MDTENPVLKKQAASQPLPPKFMRDIYSQVKDETAKEEKPSESEDLMLQLSQSEEWKHLKRFMETKMDKLLELTRLSARSNMDPAETGLRFFIFDQLDAFAKDIVSHVEMPANARKAEELLKSNVEDGEEK